MYARPRRKAWAYGGVHSKLGIGAFILALCAGPSWGCSETTLLIKDEDSNARFTVEIADTPDERNQGLMFREEMPLSAGMLFVYDAPSFVSFWMRNTLIPLDMLFIMPDGTVAHIHENAVPLDETPIPGGDGIQFVLEINGGLAKQLGLEEGAVIQHPAIDQALAAFPCN